KEVVELLLAKGIDVNGTERGGPTALQFAAAAGHADIVALLLAKGADPRKADERGWTPLHMATGKRIAELLVDKGADANARSQTGEAPLHLAAAHGHTAMIELLLEHKADPSAKARPGAFDSKNHTPLEAALHAGQVEAVQLLRKAGALPKI